MCTRKRIPYTLLDLKTVTYIFAFRNGVVFQSTHTTHFLRLHHSSPSTLRSVNSKPENSWDTRYICDVSLLLCVRAQPSGSHYNVNGSETQLQSCVNLKAQKLLIKYLSRSTSNFVSNILHVSMLVRAGLPIGRSALYSYVRFRTWILIRSPDNGGCEHL